MFQENSTLKGGGWGGCEGTGSQSYETHHRISRILQKKKSRTDPEGQNRFDLCVAGMLGASSAINRLCESTVQEYGEGSQQSY